jgi:hypothetical protein
MQTVVSVPPHDSIHRPWNKCSEKKKEKKKKRKKEKKRKEKETPKSSFALPRLASLILFSSSPSRAWCASPAVALAGENDTHAHTCNNTGTLKETDEDPMMKTFIINASIATTQPSRPLTRMSQRNQDPSHFSLVCIPLP